jgi:hypothetical protein
MSRLQVIVGSTRPTRSADLMASWVAKAAAAHGAFGVEVLDLRDWPMQAKTALMEIADPIRANPDCLDFRVYQNRYDPQSFVLWERWVSEQACLDHGKSDYMAEGNA